MLHRDVDELVPPLRGKFWTLATQLAEDARIKALGFVGIIPWETWRELPTQMAYFVRSRLIARPEDSMTANQAVQAFFDMAKIDWKLSGDEFNHPSTWTLNSKHLIREAFDFAFTRDGKTPDWKAPDEAYQIAAKYVRALGLRSGMDFPNKKDPGHVEMV